MITAVSLQVDHIDLTDPDTLHVLGTHFADSLWDSVDGAASMTIYVDSTDIASQVVRVAREVESRLHGVHVRRVKRDLVSQCDIASRVGVSREAVRKWTLREGIDAFPAPFATIGGEGRPSKVWLWSDITPWLERNYALDLKENLPNDETVAHIDACLAKVDTYLDRDWQTVNGATVAEQVRPVSARRRVHLHLVGESVVDFARSSSWSQRERVRA